MKQLDSALDAFSRMEDRLQSLSLKPSEYFARQGFISADPGEATIEGVVDVIGDRSIVFATDYPHPDALTGDVVERIAGRSGLSEESKRRILRENAERCFGLA